MISKAKAKIIAPRYIKSGFNMSEVMRQLHPELAAPDKKTHLRVKATRALASVNVKREISELMDEKGITDELLLSEHKKVLTQNKHLPSKNTALDMAYKLKGSYSPTKSESKSINIDISTKELLQELKQLDELN